MVDTGYERQLIITRKTKGGISIIYVRTMRIRMPDLANVVGKEDV